VGPGTGVHKPLGELLAERRRRLFVGRSAELELMRTALDAAEPTLSVLFIHGPGGIGKSRLLDRFAQLAEEADATVVRLDGRTLEPTPPAWRADPGWGDLLRIVSVRNLTPAESREYLVAAGVDESLRERIVAASHGHPLGLSLLTDLVSRGGNVDVDPLPADLVGILLRRFVEIMPSELHRRALEVGALARATTEALLRDALDLDDAHELFAWLRDLPFVYTGRDGLFPHDLARDALDADLRWRDPEGYKRTFRRVWAYVLHQLRSTTGREQLQAIFDLKFRIPESPGRVVARRLGVVGRSVPGTRRRRRQGHHSRDRLQRRRFRLGSRSGAVV
jgi:AAA ATPase domain